MSSKDKRQSMKTPMQELTDDLLEIGSIRREKVKQLLAKEKQVIIDAYKAGQENSDDSLDEIGETYYNETFNPLK